MSQNDEATKAYLTGLADGRRIEQQLTESAVVNERERIVELIRTDKDLRRDLYFWFEYGDHDTEGREHGINAIRLIKGETK